MSKELESKELTPAYRKKRFYTNLIQFAVGVVLLIIGYIYLQQNLAEKVSILSGLDIVYQKMTVFVRKYVGGDSKILDEKYSLERNYKELIKTIKGADCKGMIDIDALVQKYDQLQKESVDTYKTNYIAYHQFAGIYYQKVETFCKVTMR